MSSMVLTHSIVSLRFLVLNVGTWFWLVMWVSMIDSRRNSFSGPKRSLLRLKSLCVMLGLSMKRRGYPTDASCKAYP